MQKHASSESFCRIFSSRTSSSFPVLHNTINMTLRQQSGIVRLKYTLHAYMHKLCAREICVTTMHHCTHTRALFDTFLYAFGTQIERILKHYTLYLTGTVCTCTCACAMWNCSRHVTDIIVIIKLHFLLSLYLWLHCEFRALVIRIYMSIVYSCTYIVTYTYNVPLLCILPTMCTVSASHHRQMWSVH